jgi:hypothetical protein
MRSSNNQIDTEKSTDWSLRCLDNKKQELAFELTNVKTGRKHKLIFSGLGTNNVHRISEWTRGTFSIQFKTKFPANFENFDNTLAMLKPGEGANKHIHVFTVGWLATINVIQSHGNEFGMWNLYGNCRVEYGSGARIASAGSASRVGGRITSVVVDVSDPYSAGRTNLSEFSIVKNLD